MYDKYYSILDSNPSDNIKLIRKKYLKLALKFHPDKNPNHNNKFNEISEAYHIISSIHPSDDNNSNILSSSPIDLLREMLSNYDNDLADVMYDTLSTLIPNTKNERDLWKQIINIPKNELIKTGANLIKQYLDRKCNYNSHNKYNLYLNSNELKDENNIECSLDFLKKYSSIQLFINNNSISTFDLKYQNISIKYDNTIYDFNFIDKFILPFKRINTYDILLELSNIPISFINNIISISHPFLKNEKLNLSFFISSTSNIYIFNNLGIWNPTINNYSNIYLSLSFISSNNNTHEFINITDDYMYIQPDKILNICDLFNS